jgi:hypothetical protein
MQAKNHEVRDICTAAVLVVLVALVGLGGVIRLAQSVSELGPGVGDVLSFDATHHTLRDGAPPVTARRDGQPECVLDPAVIHQFGGSLIIESRSPIPDRTYRVHWAGERSSNGTGDCGRSAELLLYSDDMDVLAMAAGGYGVSHRQLGPVGLWSTGGTPLKRH